MAHLLMKTDGFSATSIQFNPFRGGVAVAASANFGIIGNGRLFLLAKQHGAIIHYDTADALMDLAWSESNEFQLVVACGDGRLKLFDSNILHFPIKEWHEHRREVMSVSWNMVDKQQLCSSSWDSTIKTWQLEHPQSIQTLQCDTSCAYEAVYSPRSPCLIACATSHGTCLFDTRSDAQKPLLQFHRSNAECLCLDWNKYEETLLHVGSTDGTVRLLDMRQTSQVLCELTAAHQMPVRRIKCSPFAADTFVTSGYDMAVKQWKVLKSGQQMPKMIYSNDEHSEFVTGLDWSLEDARTVASCSWDEQVLIHTCPLSG